METVEEEEEEDEEEVGQAEGAHPANKHGASADKR